MEYILKQQTCCVWFCDGFICFPDFFRFALIYFIHFLSSGENLILGFQKTIPRGHRFEQHITSLSFHPASLFLSTTHHVCLSARAWIQDMGVVHVLWRWVLLTVFLS